MSAERTRGGPATPARRAATASRSILVVVVCALLALPAAAFAATRLEDRDDSAGAADLSAVRASHNRVTDELVFVIDFHGPLDLRSLLNPDGPPGSVCVNAWTTRTPGEAGPNYDICASPDPRGRVLRASVTRHGGRRSVRAGEASVEQSSETRLELRFDPDLVRRPKSFRFTVQAVAFSSGCPRATGCEDYVPDRPRTAELELRAPRTAEPSP